MKVLNLNIHFYPHSYGGATIVAEKLAHGLISLGHEVTNIFLQLGAPSGQDFNVSISPFGPVVSINNVQLSAANRFYNPAVSSLLFELCDVIQPDKIIVHAPQHMGVLALTQDQETLRKITIVAHDFYWACLQGFRMLPSGRACSRQISRSSCRDCSFFPGLTDQIYDELLYALNGCQKLVFPSQYIKLKYEQIFDGRLIQGAVIQNPDKAEDLAKSCGVSISSSDTLQIGYLGGPGNAKGWDIVQELMKSTREIGGRQVRYLLFDAGKIIQQPWYTAVKKLSNVEYVPAFHWTYAHQVLKHLDMVLMPSRANESFGLIAREAISAGSKAIIFPSGALADLVGYDNVFKANEKNIKHVMVRAVSSTTSTTDNAYQNLSTTDYAKRVLED